MKLPTTLRPRGIRYREFVPGLDLPAEFLHDLKSIDEHLWLVWHPYRVMYDDVMNQYTGKLDDPRFCIGRYADEEVWGFVLTDNTKMPVREDKWHIWRLCWPYGWCHIAPVQSDHSEYLKLLARRLNVQARYKAKHGDRQWTRKLDADATEEQERQQQQELAMFDAVQEENSWLMRRAMNNFESGIVAPTNPQKENIISYPGQVNRTKTVRPIDDEEGGLIIPGR